MDVNDLLVAAFGIALGAFLKGATGAGAPVVGVPVLAVAFDVPTAIAVFSVINFVSNSWQGWRFRHAIRNPRFVATFAIGGTVGAVLGSFLLVWLPTDVLLAMLASVVFVYIGLRLARPGWQLSREIGEPVGGLVGLIGGMMQGAGGISAPVSVTFLNAMRLSREEFIATISTFFFFMSVSQMPVLVALGVLNTERMLLAVMGLVPLFGAMALGSYAARHISKETFDVTILLLLAVVALQLVYTAVT